MFPAGFVHNINAKVYLIDDTCDTEFHTTEMLLCGSADRL